MNKQEFDQLATNIADGTATQAEVELYNAWFNTYADGQSWDTGELGNPEIIKRQLLNDIHAEIKRREPAKVRPIYYRITAAASILFFLCLGTYYYIGKNARQQTTQIQINDIGPGGNKAILTLANGQHIVLTNAKNGQLALQGNTSITKTTDGNITYNQAKGQTSVLSTLAYNTVSTPIGGQYHLTLTDGTNVWLNAASSITYPTAFTGAERKVEIIGEVYFEVAHNAAKPFRVQSNQQVVEVLGTHFNINAYGDENETKTTLLEGSVKVTGSNGTKFIKPGQQAILKDNNLAITEANVEEAVAWRNGYFRFNDEKIGSVMRKLSRWYNIDVTFEGGMPVEGFNGKISRYKNISQVLKMLEKTKAVHFKVEGRRVAVMQ